MATNFRRVICVMVAVLVLMFSMIPTASAASMSAFFHSNATIYQYPSTSSASLAVPRGTTCTITAMNNGWAQITRAGITAYCPTYSLCFSNRIKGYTNKSCKIYAQASTSSASATLGANTEVYIIGIGGGYFWVQNANASVTGFIPTGDVSNQKTAVQQAKQETFDFRPYVVAMEWYNGGSKVLKRGAYTTMLDLMSGQLISIKRMGGSSHMDVEPATAADTAKLLAACGGEWSWDSRPVILYADGKFIACAINTMPHGDQTIFDNNYDGQFCLHMLGSKTHGSNKVNDLHQEAIYAAYAWAHQ